jgi:hypothetical protein
MRLYIAAPLFTEAERAFNPVLARALEAEGHDVYLPQRDTRLIEGVGRTMAIFQDNLAAFMKAEAVVAVCEGAPRSTTGRPGRLAMPTDETSRSTGSGRTRGSASRPTSGSTS